MTLLKKIQKSKINSEAWYDFIQKIQKSKNSKLIPKLDITLLILGRNQLIPISSISRIWENEENPFSSISRIWEIRKIRFPVFPGYEKIIKIKVPSISRLGLN